jgi:divalent metal cation (Fe/Co/Zn/Cd) transporter
MTMSFFDWSVLDPLGRTVIAVIETVISPSAITSLLSLSAALVATWVMQVTTHQAGLGTPGARLALAQRIALAALAIFLMLNAVTPFITPDPPWLANLPLVVAIMAFLLAFGLSHIRAERARTAAGPKVKDRSANGRQGRINPG